MKTKNKIKIGLLSILMCLTTFSFSQVVFKVPQLVVYETLTLAGKAVKGITATGDTLLTTGDAALRFIDINASLNADTSLVSRSLLFNATLYDEILDIRDTPGIGRYDSAAVAQSDTIYLLVWDKTMTKWDKAQVESSTILKVTPQSTPPTSPALGWIYVDTDDFHIYFYNGTSWVQMDN